MALTGMVHGSALRATWSPAPRRSPHFYLFLKLHTGFVTRLELVSKLASSEPQGPACLHFPSVPPFPQHGVARAMCFCFVLNICLFICVDGLMHTMKCVWKAEDNPEEIGFLFPPCGC